MRDMILRGRTAVVTGAASGIGRAIAISLAQRGCNLALADINEAGLKETVQLLPANEGRITTYRLDVGDRDSVTAFPREITADHPAVDILVNNAGVALGGSFQQVSEENFDWLFSINFFGVVRMTRAFLPILKASDDARLVNISSVFGLIAPPGHAAYVASKFAVRGFSESLRNELAGTTVGVTVVHPGGVATSISKNARVPDDTDPAELERRRSGFDKFLRLAPSIAGERIVKGIEKRKARVLVGADAHALSIVERLAPVSYWKLLGQGVRR